MNQQIQKTFVYCLVFLMCGIIGYLIYPFYNLLSIFIILVLMVYLCSIFSTDKMKFQKYAIILLILFFVAHIMGLGAALVWSIYVLMEYDFSYLRSSHGHEYPLMMLVTTCVIFCLTSLYTCYYNKSHQNVNYKTKTNDDIRENDYGSRNNSSGMICQEAKEFLNTRINISEYRENLFDSNASLLSSNMRTTTV